MSAQDSSAVLIFIGVALGGGLGSVIRMLLARWQGSGVPGGILVANTIGAVAATVAYQLDLGLWTLVLSAGVAGGLSTFSTWAAQTAELWQSDRKADAINNLLLHLTVPTFAVLITLFALNS